MNNFKSLFSLRMVLTVFNSICHSKDFDAVSKESYEISNGSEESSDDDHLTDRQVMKSDCEDREGCNMEKAPYSLRGFRHVL